MESYENKTMELLGAKTPKELFEKTKFMLETIHEISEAKGRYDTDRMKHAMNTIQDMQELATTAIKKLTDLEWATIK